MLTHFIVSFVASVVVGSAAPSGGCLLEDQFSVDSGLWNLIATEPSLMTVSDSLNNRLDFWSPSVNNGSESTFAAAVAAEWKMDLTQDWAMQGRWHMEPPIPTAGDVGVALAVIFEGDSNSFDLQRAYTLSGGIYSVPGAGLAFHETTNLWIANERYQQTSYGRIYNESITYVWYDASSRRIYYDDELYGSDAIGVWIGGMTNSNEGVIALASYSIGYVASFGVGDLWIDDFCLISGNVIGLESCPGDVDGDGYIDVNDVLGLINVWDTADSDADFDGDGLVDADDVLILLSHYGEACP